MENIYWITRLDSFITFLTVLCVLSSIILSISIITRLLDDIECTKIFKKYLKIFIPILIFSVLGLIFVPTTKETLLIYGVGGTIDYMKSDSIASKLPQKAIIALDKYLESDKNRKENE